MEDYKEFYRFTKHFPAGLTRLFENGRGPAAATAAKASNKDKSGSQKKKQQGSGAGAKASASAAPVVTETMTGPSVNELRERLHNKIQESKKGKHRAAKEGGAQKNPEKVKKGISKEKDRKQKQNQNNNKPAKQAESGASSGKAQPLAAAQKSSE